jgi:aldose sugar dehydrogenase
VKKNIYHITTLLFIFAGIFLGCQTDDSSSATPFDALFVGKLPPLETQPPVASNQKPAFAGQTRALGIKTQMAINVTTIASGLSYPWGLDFLPDGRMLVSEKSGSIKIIAKDGTIAPPLTGLPSSLFSGEGGLMDIKVDPDFVNSRLIFWTYVETITGGSVTAVGRGRLSADSKKLDETKVIFRATPAYTENNHYGSRMLFDKQGLLYITTGDRYNDLVRGQAQELNSLYGKVVRINKDGSIAKGNPFENTPFARKEIYSYGHRNPQGLAINPANNELWLSDHGPQAGDEINLIKPGANYGWPIVSYGLEYSGLLINNGKTVQSGTTQPIYYYDPAIAPSGMTFYDGNLMPEWKGSLFVGALKGKHLVRLIIKNNKVIAEERLLEDKNLRIRHVAQGPEGALYVITDSENGQLLRISN